MSISILFIDEKTISLHSCLDFVLTTLLIYPLSAVVLFYAFCQISSDHLVEIQMEVDELITQKPTDTVSRVKGLVEHYFYITNLVRQINRFFGLILLLVLSIDFVLILMELVFLVVFYTNGTEWYHSFDTAFCCVCFTINILAVSFASDNVSNEVFLRST